MREMVEAGEVAALVPERVWQETESALGESRPDIYFQVLQNCGALAVVFPEIAALFGVLQPEQWHPEIDTGQHILLALQESARLGHTREVRFAVLVHDLGKGTTPKHELPRHLAHEQRGAALVEQLCNRLAVPNRFRDLAIAVTRQHGNCHRALELKPATLLSLLEGLDAFRRADRVEPFLDACEADARGRTGLETRPYPQRELLYAVWQAARSVDTAAVAKQGLAGEALGAAIRQARLEASATARARFMADRAASEQPE
jgi:tRNA nucleotidyltransferase (CCA-adding enzyme)